MIVSTKHRFVFLSNRKCASSSLVHSLQKHSGMIAQTDQRLRHTNFREYRDHIKPWLEARTGENTDDYKIYCLFREPTEWLFSWYRFRQRKEISPEVQPDHWEYTGNMTWQDFLDGYFTDPRPKFARVGTQANFVMDGKGHIGPNALYAFDRMPEMIADIEDRIGEELDIVEYNVSPKTTTALTPEDYAYCKERLKRDYAVYNSLGL